MHGKTKKVTIKAGTPGTGVQNMTGEDPQHLEQGETYVVDEDFAALLVGESRAHYADKDTPTFEEKAAKAAKAKGKAPEDEGDEKGGGKK